MSATDAVFAAQAEVEETGQAMTAAAGWLFAAQDAGDMTAAQTANLLVNMARTSHYQADQRLSAAISEFDAELEAGL